MSYFDAWKKKTNKNILQKNQYSSPHNIHRGTMNATPRLPPYCTLNIDRVKHSNTHPNIDTYNWKLSFHIGDWHLSTLLVLCGLVPENNVSGSSSSLTDGFSWLFLRSGKLVPWSTKQFHYCLICKHNHVPRQSCSETIMFLNIHVLKQSRS